jgi:hypothetical protein
MRRTRELEDFEHLKSGKLREMEKGNLSGHQSRMLELTCRTVFAPFDRVFSMEVVDR